MTLPLIWFDKKTQRFYKNNKPVSRLTLRAYRALQLFSQKPYTVIHRDELVSYIWGGDLATDESLSQVIRELRRTLKTDKSTLQYIVTWRGMGYQFLPDGDPNGGEIEGKIENIEQNIVIHNHGDDKTQKALESLTQMMMQQQQHIAVLGDRIEDAMSYTSPALGNQPSRLFADDDIQIVIDENTKQVKVSDKIISTTHLEYRFLQTLAKQRYRPISKEELAEEIWNSVCVDSSIDAIHSTVKRLRKKFGAYANCLETHHGRGYSLNHVEYINVEVVNA